MGLIDWILRRSPKNNEAPRIEPPVAPLLSRTDGQDEVTAVTDRASEEIDLEPIFTMIEYEDSVGAVTRRRITMKSLVPAASGWILRAVCHERRALRAFRTDRIAYFFDAHGEVTEPEAFWRQLGITLEARVTPSRAGAALRDRFRPAISIMVALARADGHFDAEQVDIILAYVEAEADELGLAWTPADIDALALIIPRMRPSAESLPGYFDTVQSYRQSRLDRFRRALRALVLSDGVIHQDEAAFMEMLAEWESLAPDGGPANA